MNSEELEESLKAEFENHLKRMQEGATQQIAEFQSRIQSDLERHRSEIDEAFRGFADRFDGQSVLDGGFASLVAEHMKLARDEGAKLAATAYAEAEKIEEPVDNSKGFADLRNAINDISSKESQAAILASLVEHAAEFAPRGAFFIIKHEHFAGWKAFGDQTAEQRVSDIHFPVTANSILGRAAETRNSVEASYGSHGEDAAFLDKLNFGQPDKMYAVPLVARGRGVAVLYVDHGTGAGAFNLEAVETLVRIAGMTVELMAMASQPAAEAHPAPAAQPASEQHYSEPDPAPAAVDSDSGHSAEHAVQEVPYHEAQPVERTLSPEPSFGYSEPEAVEAAPEYEASVTEVAPDHSYQEEIQPPEEQPAEEEVRAEPEYADSSTYDAQPSYEPQPESPSFVMNEHAPEPAPAISPFERAVSPFEPAAPIGSNGVATMEQAVEVAPPAVEVAAPPAPPVTRGRLSDRQVDLPIEVPDEERRLHNDARRFARLLVSEIKLYNEKRVSEGRQAHDLYDRLKEAIDRSREMYDKRVQPTVAARFDYFHYELVNSLGEGDAKTFGSAYPGPTV